MTDRTHPDSGRDLQDAADALKQAMDNAELRGRPLADGRLSAGLCGATKGR